METFKEIRFKIQRYDPEKGAPPHMDEFIVPITRGMTVLEGLLYIKEQMDNSLAFRSSCRMSICGSCAMLINSFPHLACHTQIEELEADTIQIKPLPNYAVIKDLVIDLTPLFEKHKSIKPYLIRPEGEEGDSQVNLPFGDPLAEVGQAYHPALGISEIGEEDSVMGQGFQD